MIADDAVKVEEGRSASWLTISRGLRFGTCEDRRGAGRFTEGGAFESSHRCWRLVPKRLSEVLSMRIRGRSFVGGYMCRVSSGSPFGLIGERMSGSSEKFA